MEEIKPSKYLKSIEKFIFSSKFLLIPFYIGLMVALVIYSWVFCKTIYFSLKNIFDLNEETGMLFVLAVVDMVMIANLVKMIITGSYNSFVSKQHGYEGEMVSSGMLKVKMATSLIGVSSIYLLSLFINIKNVEYPYLIKQLMIHSIFLIGAVVLAVVDYLHVKSEKLLK